MRRSGSGLTGNELYEGYIPDLLVKIFSKLNRVYEIHVVADNKYGSEQSNGKWDGMIGEVMDNVS